MQILCHALTKDFLIYATNNGAIHQYYLKGGEFINEFRNGKDVIAIYPYRIGTRWETFKCCSNFSFLLGYQISVELA
jgi:hypothetical protein